MAEQEHIPPLMPAVHIPDPRTSDPLLPTPRSLVYSPQHRTPKPTASQYLVKVQAAAVSRGELTWPEVLDTASRGVSPAVIAHDVCGSILATPQTDEQMLYGPTFKVGDEVFGLLAFDKDGGAADCAVAEEKELAFRPRNVSAAEACTVPLSALSAWQAFFEHGGLEHVATLREEDMKEGEERLNSRRGSGGSSTARPLRVLITNASGGVGVQAIQLLRSHTLFGTRKFWICGTCSHRNSSFVLDDLRADAVVDYTVSPDIDEAFASRGWEPVDLVLDCIGGETQRRVHSPAVVRDSGVVVSVANPPPADDDDVAAARERGVKSSFFVVEPNGEQLQKIATLVENGEVRGVVDGVYDLVDARQAMERVESQRARGKVVLRVNCYS